MVRRQLLVLWGLAVWLVLSFLYVSYQPPHEYVGYQSSETEANDYLVRWKADQLAHSTPQEEGRPRTGTVTETVPLGEVEAVEYFDLAAIIKDPEFLALDEVAQRYVLDEIDPDFKQLPYLEQEIVIRSMNEKAKANKDLAGQVAAAREAKKRERMISAEWAFRWSRDGSQFLVLAVPALILAVPLYFSLGQRT